jgi:hypothetical protein
MFHAKFMHIIQEWKNDPQRGQLTQKDRKTFIESAYSETDDSFFGRRRLTDLEIRLQALTKVFYKVLAEEPWSEDWIRAPDVERKLSKFEMNKDTVALATEHGLLTPRDAVKAAREAALKQAEALKELTKDPKKTHKDLKIPRGPYDEIEIIYIAGTVSSTATNKIDRENIYPVSVSSVANVLQNHICRDMVRPYSMAERFLNMNDAAELEKMRKFACDVCDYAPHLLDNDNVSLLVVLLILSRSDCCKRFENNGIRIEGSTISHRKAECMKNKMGWGTPELKKPYDTFAAEFQQRVKNACYPGARPPRVTARARVPRRSVSDMQTMHTPVYSSPQMGYMASPQVRGTPGSAAGRPFAPGPGMIAGPPSAPPALPPSVSRTPSVVQNPPAPLASASRTPSVSKDPRASEGSSVAEPMDLS